MKSLAALWKRWDPRRGMKLRAVRRLRRKRQALRLLAELEREERALWERYLHAPKGLVAARLLLECWEASRQLRDARQLVDGM